MKRRFPQSLPVWITAGMLGLLLLFFILPEEVAEMLWMQALGYEAVFWKLLGMKAGLFAVCFLLVALFFGVNTYVVLENFPLVRWRGGDAELGPPQVGDLVITPQRLKVAALGFTLLAALLFSVNFAARWDTLLRFTSGATFGETDPIFGKDLAFYVLRLPFWEMVQGMLVGLALIGLMGVVALHTVLGNLAVRRGRVDITPGVRWQLAANAALLLAMWGWGYYLDRYSLLLRPSGVVYGAGYTDLHIVIPALWVMCAASLAAVGAVFWFARTGRPRALFLGLGGFLALGFVGLALVPGFYQQVNVEPNELQLEAPYLRHNIALTRRAYGLDAVEERPYPATGELSLEAMAGNEETLQNIRLWDPRLLILTYRQLQEIRLYYQFYQVDVDRYRIGDSYRQVMLSARELARQLPERANTWVNRTLQYTHGYGIAMSPVAQQGEEGVPILLVRDLPPESAPGLSVEQPAIYYGEETPGYRLVNTEVPELDYPSGDENVYTSYEGKGGVRLGSFWRRLLFSLVQSDFNILLSGYVTPESRIQFWRTVRERVTRVAPFLRLDADPYLVLTEGRLYWIQDAYTTSRTFPYAEPTREGFNYIRNSVKVVIDAFDGTVEFYVADEDDPVLAAYRQAFPELFRPLTELSEELQAHLRYPQDLFSVQVEKYNRYHMTIPQVFYNNEDLWNIPMEQYGGQQIPMRPYYLLTQLPDEPRQQFVLMTPLTPQNRDNMVAWMAAKSDQPDYGELVVYKLPKERLIYGPNQIESKIDQDTEVSQQLSLWDQRGSRVIRGNLMVVPIASSFLYVEPIFLIAEGTQIPQLQRVIVAQGERVAMARTLDEALQLVFGASVSSGDGFGGGATTGVPPEAIARARETLDRAFEALREGSFGTFGVELQRLRTILGETPLPADVGAVSDTTALQNVP